MEAKRNNLHECLFCEIDKKNNECGSIRTRNVAYMFKKQYYTSKETKAKGDC